MRKATNKNWQRVTAAAAALALCAGVLTGCGASSSTAASSTAASSAAASEVSSEEADEMVAKNVADLIDAIYVQERNENTDAQCEAGQGRMGRPDRRPEGDGRGRRGKPRVLWPRHRRRL